MCTTYKTHAVTTCHGGAGHTGENRDLDSHTEDTAGIDMGPTTAMKAQTIQIL